MDLSKKASEIVEILDLKPHPHGGFCAETFRDPSITLSNSHLTPILSSAIYFVLPSGGIAHLHRIPCAETWHYYMGEPLMVFEVHEDGKVKLTVVGTDLEEGQRPQYTVPPNVWFGAFQTYDLDSFRLTEVRFPKHRSETVNRITVLLVSLARRPISMRMMSWRRVIG